MNNQTEKYKVYVVENNNRRLIATFEDVGDAREYVDFIIKKHGSKFVILPV